MKSDQEKVRFLLIDTIALLCKNGLSFKNELKIQGLLGITVDGSDVFIVHIDETFSEAATPSRQNASAGRDVQSKSVGAPAVGFRQPIRVAKGNAVPPLSASKIGRKRVRAGVQPMKREKTDWRDNAGTWDGMQQGSSKTGDQGMNDDGSPETKPTDMMWLESDALNESTAKADLGSPPALGFDPDNDMVAFGWPVNSSFGSNVGDVVPGSLISSTEMALKTEDGMEMKSPDAVCVRTNRQSAGRRKSRRNSSGVPLMAGASRASPVSRVSDTQWPAADEAIGYSMPAAVAWENEDENVQQEDYEEWSNWESRRGTNKRSAKTDDDREKSFVCQYDDCDKAFYRRDHLIRHQRIKHGKPFGVDSQTVFYCHFANCGKIFYKNASLHRHMNDAHGFVPQE